MPGTGGLNLPKLQLRLRAWGPGEPLALGFEALANWRKTNLSWGTPGQRLEGCGRQALPGEVAIHGRLHPEQPPPAVGGPVGEKLGPRWRADPTLQPGRPWQASGVLLALRGTHILGSQPSPAPFPQGPGVTHREVPKVRATAGFSG